MSIDDALVMILAGGEGKRLYPLTKDRAKLMELTLMLVGLI